METDVAEAAQTRRSPCTCTALTGWCPACLQWEYDLIQRSSAAHPTRTALRGRLIRKRRLASRMRRAGDLDGAQRIQVEIAQDLKALRHLG